VKLTLHD